MKAPVQVLLGQRRQGETQLVDKAQIIGVEGPADDFARHRAVFERDARAQAVEEFVAIPLRDLEGGAQERVENAFQGRRLSLVPARGFQEIEPALRQQARATRENLREHRLLRPEMIMDRRQADAGAAVKSRKLTAS